MGISRKIVSITGFIAILGLLIYFPGRKLARAHVNYKTAVEDHPLLCTNCHLYIQKDGLISNFLNRDYLSPLNLEVSVDGKILYVVTQDDNSLMIVDADKGKVLNRIGVGMKPHSVIIDNNGKTAYVSNQWSDNVSVIDLISLTVTDTLSTGDGPAGLSLSNDGKYLYVVNSYSSDLSVIDLETGTEQKRLETGNNPTGTCLSPDGRELIVTSRRANVAHYGEPLISE
jgi:YVTN family beta-propeller protein